MSKIIIIHKGEIIAKCIRVSFLIYSFTKLSFLRT